MSDIPSSSWVTVAEAADRAGVDSSTVRQWYRSGKLPTRRADGEHGAFLVPLAGVLDLAPATPSPNGVGSELVQQVEFLRNQLAEVSEENRELRQRLHDEEERRADLRARLADTEDELVELRKVAARSSIVDASWLEERTPAYQSPVRPQSAPAPPPPAPSPTLSNDLADLLAATRPDGEDDEVTVLPPDDRRRPTVGPHAVDDGDDEAPFVPPRPVSSSDPVAYGTHADDLLPAPERPDKRGRRPR